MYVHSAVDLKLGSVTELLVLVDIFLQVEHNMSESLRLCNFHGDIATKHILTVEWL